MAQKDKIGALWKNISQKGDEYLTGVIGGKKVIIFLNKNKKESKHPDWIVYLQQSREELLPKKDEGSVPF